MRFHVGRGHHRSRQNAFPETGSETLDLIFNAFQHVDSAAIGRMTIGPRCVLASGRASGIKQRRLREQDKWPFGYLSLRRSALRFSDFFQRAADVYSSGAGTFGRVPWHRAVERPVHLEHARAITIILKNAPLTFVDLVTSNLKELSRSDVAQHRTRRWQFCETLHAMFRKDLAAQRTQQISQCV